jgi:hypothetical protein
MVRLDLGPELVKPNTTNAVDTTAKTPSTASVRHWGEADGRAGSDMFNSISRSENVNP